MDPLFDEAISRLSQLDNVRDTFIVRADRLPADLAVLGLCNEIREAAYSAVELCRLHAQSAAFPSARTVFEATQQLIVLATEGDYIGVGTRAWLYHHRKEKRIAQFARGTQAADQWYAEAIRELQQIWVTYNIDAEKILRRENAQLDGFQKNRGAADNFMGRNLGRVVQERYAKLADVFGKSAAELGKLNSGIYAALSRESHAQLRLDLERLRVAPDRTVTIIPRKVDEATKDKLILGCVTSSLSEARAALSYLVDTLQKHRLEELANAAGRLAKLPIAAGFKPDLGLHLMRLGRAYTTFHFPNVPIQKVGILVDGTVRWSGNITFEDQEVYCATFDVPQCLVPELASRLGIEGAVFAPSPELKKHTLALPRTLRLECALGEIEASPGDAFVPLSVKSIAVQEAAPSS